MFTNLIKKLKQKCINATTKKVSALSLVETIISMAILAVLFILMINSLNAIMLGSYLIDARTAVRTEGEFVSEFFTLYVKNADPRTIIATNETSTTNICTNTRISEGVVPTYAISWQPLGSGETFTFNYEETDTTLHTGRFVFNQVSGATTMNSVLTYGDVGVHNVVMSCEGTTDPLTGQTLTTVTVQFQMDSTLQLGGQAAVQNVQRYVTVVIR